MAMRPKEGAGSSGKGIERNQIGLSFEQPHGNTKHPNVTRVTNGEFFMHCAEEMVAVAWRSG